MANEEFLTAKATVVVLERLRAENENYVTWINEYKKERAQLIARILSLEISLEDEGHNLGRGEHDYASTKPGNQDGYV